MGQVTESGTVIDESFAGLARPQETHAMGRPDILEGRPGETLVSEVRRFEESGGFEDLRKREAREREAAAAAPVREPLPDFGTPDGPARAREAELSGADDSGD